MIHIITKIHMIIKKYICAFMYGMETFFSMWAGLTYTNLPLKFCWNPKRQNKWICMHQRSTKGTWQPAAVVLWHPLSVVHWQLLSVGCGPFEMVHWSTPTAHHFPTTTVGRLCCLVGSSLHTIPGFPPSMFSQCSLQCLPGWSRKHCSACPNPMFETFAQLTRGLCQASRYSNGGRKKQPNSFIVLFSPESLPVPQTATCLSFRRRSLSCFSLKTRRLKRDHRPVTQFGQQTFFNLEKYIFSCTRFVDTYTLYSSNKYCCHFFNLDWLMKLWVIVVMVNFMEAWKTVQKK